MNSVCVGATVQLVAQNPVLHVGMIFVQTDRPRDGAVTIIDTLLFHSIKAEIYRGFALDIITIGILRFDMDLIVRGNVAALQIRRKHAPIGQLVILIFAKRGQCAGKALVVGFISETVDTGRSTVFLYDRDALCRIQLDIGHDIFQLNRITGCTIGARYFYGVLYSTIFKVIVAGILLGVKITLFIVIFLNGDLAGVAIVELDCGFRVVLYVHFLGFAIESQRTTDFRTFSIFLHIRIVESNGNITTFYFANANSFFAGIIDDAVFFEIFQSIRQVVLNGV